MRSGREEGEPVQRGVHAGDHLRDAPRSVRPPGEENHQGRSGQAQPLSQGKNWITYRRG